MGNLILSEGGRVVGCNDKNAGESFAQEHE